MMKSGRQAVPISIFSQLWIVKRGVSKNGAEQTGTTQKEVDVRFSVS